MRVRADSVFISSLLLTVALLYFIRPALWYYGASGERAARAGLDAGYQGEAYADHYFGVACLAIILIGLIVVWTGYAKRSRPAWLVMFVIVWFWAFPVFILPSPLARGYSTLTFPEFLYYAISGPGMTTQMVRAILMFLMMVVALALPMGRFFIARKANKPVHLPSRRLGISLLMFHSGGIARVVLLVAGWRPLRNSNWQLNTFFVPPPPLPPPTPLKNPDGN